jgi:flagellar biosynthesis anti-sigma factor FlgM
MDSIHTSLQSSKGLSLKPKAAAIGAESSNPLLKQGLKEPLDAQASALNLSKKAHEISLAKNVLNQTPDVNEERIEHFRSLIAKGQYSIDPDKIANGILLETLRDELSLDTMG